MRSSDTRLYKNRSSPRGIIGGSSALQRSPFLPSLTLNLHLRYLDMSGTNLFAGAHHFVASNNTYNEARTVSAVFTKGSNVMALDIL